MTKFHLLTIFLLLICSITLISASEVNSWAYQLQNYNLDDLESYDTDLIVMDYSKDGAEETKFTADEITQIKDSGKIVISYISIGEAEDYRYYWDDNWLTSPPSWFGGENEDWPGNYKVRYWEQGWQDIVFEYIDKIISQGFNGIYLDIIDAYEYYESTNSQSEQDMIDFVIEISEYAKNKEGSDFMIFPQNGENLLSNQDYRNAIDGIGREDVYISDNKIRDEFEINEIEEQLDLLIQDEKLVLVVDYTDNPDQIEFARESAKNKGYLHYIGVLELDELIDQTNVGNSTISPSFIIAIPIIVLIRKLKLFIK